MKVDIQVVKRLFNPVVGPTRARKVRPCCVMIDGKTVRMGSGKMAWNNIGPCKSAIRNHLDRRLGMEEVNYIMDNYVSKTPVSKEDPPDTWAPIQIVLI